MPTLSTGVGNSIASGSSTSTTLGASIMTARASSRLTGAWKVACTASECVVTTGTRTHVAETFSSGMPRIFRDSLRTFSSSLVQPSSLREPAHGTTFMASGAGKGECPSPSLSAMARRTSPALEPSDRSPATTSSSSCSRSMPA